MAQKKKSKSGAASTRRTSVTFPSDLYQTLEQIANEQKLSVAWLIRDAAEKYVTARSPSIDRKG